MLNLEYIHVWSNGSLEFSDDIELRNYYIDNNITPDTGGDEFTRVSKIIVKDV